MGSSTVPFRYVGVVTEFPTAPRDSFFVANADYLTTSSGSDAVGAFLVDTGGQDTAGTAERIRGRLGPGPSVTDIAQVRGRIGSSLTSVDLAGLTCVELGFALALAAAAGGLVPALGLGERRRSFAIARARREPEPAAWLLAVAGVALAVLGIVGNRLAGRTRGDPGAAMTWSQPSTSAPRISLRAGERASGAGPGH